MSCDKYICLMALQENDQLISFQVSTDASISQWLYLNIMTLATRGILQITASTSKSTIKIFV